MRLNLIVALMLLTAGFFTSCSDIIAEEKTGVVIARRAQIRSSTAVAAAGLNIHNMLNKSKGEMAYTLVDLDSPVTPDLCKQIAAIPGVLMIRYLPADLS